MKDSSSRSTQSPIPFLPGFQVSASYAQIMPSSFTLYLLLLLDGCSIKTSGINELLKRNLIGIHPSSASSLLWERLRARSNSGSNLSTNPTRDSTQSVPEGFPLKLSESQSVKSFGICAPSEESPVSVLRDEAPPGSSTMYGRRSHTRLARGF